MSTSVIRYRFRPPSGDETRFDLRLDDRTAELHKPDVPDPPEWARLEFRQCPNCPLKPDEHPLCPVAHSLIDVVPRFEDLVSFSRLTVRVETEARTISASTDLQAALSSMMGLIMASSGCPRTLFPADGALSPAARRRGRDRPPRGEQLVARTAFPADWWRQGLSSLDGLVDAHSTQVVNAGLTSRLRAASVRTDAQCRRVAGPVRADRARGCRRVAGGCARCWSRFSNSHNDAPRPRGQGVRYTARH